MKRALIVDMDNTMSINVTGRRWYGKGFEHHVFDDDVNTVVNDVITRLIEENEGYTPFADHILFVSGRMEAGREQTVRWLTEKARQYPHQYTLLMRQDEDFREDVIIKQEIYERHIKGKYDVMLALDDKPSIIALWRSLGIPCWQVREYE